MFEQSAKGIVEEDLKYICSGLQAELKALEGKNVLVAGGAGFLGHYLVQALTAYNRGLPPDRKVTVTVYDNYIRGVPQWLSSLQGDQNLALVKHDITQPLPDDIGHQHYIIHAASIASPTYYRKYPIETMDANVNGLRHLLEYCRSQKDRGFQVEGFLFYSTSEIYGDPDPQGIPTPETYRGYVSCTGPRACYDESKRYGETLCVNFASAYGLPIQIARPFNNYGPGLKITDRRVLPDFARDVFEGRDIVMLSDGSPTRTFCYIADAIIGYFKVLIRGSRGEAYNIGVEAPEISMAELADRVVAIASELIGYSGKVVRKESPDKDYLEDNPNRRCPIIAKARDELGYNPTITIEDGLLRALIWYRDNPTAEDA